MLSDCHMTIKMHTREAPLRWKSAERINCSQVFCDTVGEPSRWRERLESRFPLIRCRQALLPFPNRLLLQHDQGRVCGHLKFIGSQVDCLTMQSALVRIQPEKNNSCSFTVCPKADALYPIVSAASIVAKVSRDREIKAYEGSQVVAEEASLQLGSGYPSGNFIAPLAVSPVYIGQPCCICLANSSGHQLQAWWWTSCWSSCPKLTSMLVTPAHPASQ